ncbi:hypothetical protein T492DRAFT_833140 [Pavlovales sp. CCMP2436]|nr:hypothetical protein T492DRAFT_833140 [Pavlovales sp. CCMP2436]
MYVRVQSASIPIVQPNVNATNNKLVLFYGASLTLTATIPIGNYTSGTDLVTAMNATTTFGTIIGMNELNNLIIPTGVATTTPRMLDLSGVRSIIIACENFELDCMDSQQTIGASTTNLLICIPQSAAYGDILTYKTEATPFVVARRRNLSTIAIQLLDENQSPYDTQGRVAGFGARALPVVQRFGNAAGDFLHKGSAIGNRVAKLARSGLNALEKSELGRIPGVGELIGVGRDASNFVDMASRAANRVGDFASNVGQSRDLRGLTSQFERTANTQQQRYA